MKKIYVVILNYNDAENTISCLKSLENIVGLEVVPVVVDNNSSSECKNRLREFIQSRFTLIENHENRGYAAGNNPGIRYAIENGAEYIAILNSDVIVSEDSFSPCVKILDNDKDVAVVGPAILDYGTDIIQSAGSKINCIRVTAELLKHGEIYSPNAEIISCDYVGGACMIFRADLIKQIGYLPEEYFLFWEEADWCMRAAKKGLRCVCTMEASVMHKGSATVNKFEGLSDYFMERNRPVFAKNVNAGLTGWISIAYLFLKAIKDSVLIDKRYIKKIQYYIDGLQGKIRNLF